MPKYRVRMEEEEKELYTAVSYATFHVDANDDPKRVFRQLKKHNELKWERVEEEDESDIDCDERYDDPEYVGEDDESAEAPVRGTPSDYGLAQLTLA